MSSSGKFNSVPSLFQSSPSFSATSSIWSFDRMSSGISSRPINIKQILEKLWLFEFYRKNYLSGMRHLSISIWIKKTLLSKYFCSFKISIFNNIWPKKCFKCLGKVKILKDPAGFELMTYRSNPLCYAVRYITISGKKKFIKLCMILLFISIKSMSQYGGVPDLKQLIFQILHVFVLR